MKHYSGDLETIQQEINDFDLQIALTQEQIKNVKEAIPTYEKYFELFKDMAEILINNRKYKTQRQDHQRVLFEPLFKSTKKWRKS